MRARAAGLAALAAWLAAAPAFATDWILLPDLVARTRVDFVDRDSLRVENGEAEALIYTVFDEDRPSEMAAIEVRFRFDCARPRGRILFARTFDLNQQVRSEGPVTEDWSEISATNFLAFVRPFACSNGGSPSGTSLGSARPFARARQVLMQNRTTAR